MWPLLIPKDLTNLIQRLAYKHNRNQREAALMLMQTGTDIATLQEKGAKILIQFPDTNVLEVYDNIFREAK